MADAPDGSTGRDIPPSAPAPPPQGSAPPPQGSAPPPQAVQIVNFPKLFGTLLLSILAAIAIVMGLSQATGYNLYTGDELESHQAERIQQQFEDDGSGGGGSGNWDSYEDCLADPVSTLEECDAAFPDGF